MAVRPPQDDARGAGILGGPIIFAIIGVVFVVIIAMVILVVH